MPHLVMLINSDYSILVRNRGVYAVLRKSRLGLAGKFGARAVQGMEGCFPCGLWKRAICQGLFFGGKLESETVG